MCSKTARRSPIGDGRTLTTIDSPGHAKHHLALHDSDSGIIFAGDAVGVRLPDIGVLRPATPPADFDLDQALTSLQKFRDRNPQGVALAHYGLLPDPAAMLEEAQDTLRQWADVAEKAWREDRDIAEALEAAFGDALGDVPRAPGEAGDAQRHPLQRRRPEAVAGDHQGRTPRAPALSLRRAPAPLPLRYWVW